jgi:hypothetical protein
MASIALVLTPMEQPKTLQAAIRYYSDEQVCIDTVAALRWPDGKPTCPACGHQDHYYLKTQKRWNLCSAEFYNGRRDSSA